MASRLATTFFGGVTGLSAISGVAGSATVASGSDGVEGTRKVDTIVLGGGWNAANPLFATTVGCISQ